ncbi:MAG: methyltransferase domain-containing protein [Rhodocyclaceae bacterium]|nr:methyltransferase domain-containing protein [Rhodocyclaceae bacterium]MBX3669573.1 methyltransferase domain-containing protein [Rhodocyclaceae bacterium]
MSKPQLDWTSVSDDPNNSSAKRVVREQMARIRQVHSDCDLVGYATRRMQGRRVLDIGVVSHAMHYVDKPGWRHAEVRRAASYCLGVDILEAAVNELNARGFNVRCVDATSEADLGERFDVVFIGDVLEHVNNPVGLLAFAGRHLAPGGRVLVSTPNPFSRKFFRRFQREGVVVVNLDHVAWISPTMALELGRRAGLNLDAYHLAKPLRPWKLAAKRVLWRFQPVEYGYSDYLYEYALADRK